MPEYDYGVTIAARDKHDQLIHTTWWFPSLREAATFAVAAECAENVEEVRTYHKYLNYECCDDGVYRNIWRMKPLARWNQGEVLPLVT